MGFSEVRPCAPQRFLVALGCKPVRMVRARMPNPAFQYLAMNHASLFQMMLVDHDFSEQAERVDPQGMVCSQGRSKATSSLTIPSEVSVCTATFSFAISCQKLGHPVPESNFVFESNRTLLQQTVVEPSALL